MKEITTSTAIWGGAALVTGLAVGVGAGLMLAPQSGARTRQHLRHLAAELGEHAGSIADEAKQAVAKLV